MKVLVYGLNFAPELTGVGRYTGDMAEWLAEHGHEVEVVTSYPYYPHWKLAAGYPTWRWSRERRRGMTVTRCPIWVPSAPAIGTRLLHLFSFAASSAVPALIAALRRRPDIVLVVEPTSFCGPVALLAARLAGAQSWLHVQDIEIGAMVRAGLLGDRRWLTAAGQRFYARLLRSYDRVTTLSSRMRTKLAEYGRSTKSIDLFPNWVDPRKWKPVDASAIRVELGLGESDVCVLYAGNLGEKQGLDGLLEVAERLEGETRIRFVICGAGAFRERIEQALPSRPNIRLIDPLPDERFVELLSAADIHVLPQKRGMTHYVMPSKLGPMLASGRAIVAQADTDCVLHGELADCAVVVPPEDAAAMAVAIRALADDSAGRRELGARARDSVYRWDREVVLAAAMGLIEGSAGATEPETASSAA